MSIRNVYYDSSHIDNQNISTTDLTAQTITTSGLTIKGSVKGDVLIIGDTNGTVEGLALGTTNDILVANPSGNGLPGYVNDITVNSVTTNDLKINGMVTGDLLVGVTSNYADRLPIGPTGYILTSNGTDPIWNPLSLPFNNAMLFVDGTGLIYGERAAYSISPSPVTFTSSTTIYTLNVATVNTRNYKVSISFNNTISGGGQNTYSLAISGIGTFLSYVTADTSSQENIILPFNANATGTVSISLIGAHTGVGGTNGTAYKVYILCEPLGF